MKSCFQNVIARKLMQLPLFKFEFDTALPHSVPITFLLRVHSGIYLSSGISGLPGFFKQESPLQGAGRDRGVRRSDYMPPCRK